MKYLTESETNQILASMRDYAASMRMWPNALELKCRAGSSFADFVGAAMDCAKDLAGMTLKGEIRGGRLYCRFVKK